MRDPVLAKARPAFDAGTIQSPEDLRNHVEAGYPAPAVSIDTAAHAAATSPVNALPEPTQAQKEAGNYVKGHTTIGGLNISIENPQGSTRSGVAADGSTWSNELQDHYGYVLGTTGGDGEHVDVFIKPGTSHEYQGPVFVIDQHHENGTGAFDEHKAMIGYPSISSAEAAYQSNYHDDWKGGVSITPMTFDEFKSWSKDPAQTAVPANSDAGAPDAPVMSAVDRRAADRPTAPTGDVLPGDIVSTITGAPFVTASAANRALAKAGPGHVLARVADGQVVRPIQQETSNAADGSSQPTGVQQERGRGNEGGQAAEAGGGDRVLGQAESAGQVPQEVRAQVEGPAQEQRAGSVDARVLDGEVARGVGAAASDLSGRFADDMLDGQYATPSDRAAIPAKLADAATKAGVPVDALRSEILQHIAIDERLTKRQTKQLVDALKKSTPATSATTPGATNGIQRSDRNQESKPAARDTAAGAGQPTNDRLGGTPDQVDARQGRATGVDAGAARDAQPGAAGRDAVQADGTEVKQRNDGGDAEAARRNDEAVTSGLAALKEKWSAAGIEHAIFEKDGVISLGRIQVPKGERGGGIGASAMSQLTSYADETKQRIELTPSTDFGATSVSRLKAFYKRFGFVENKGRNKDFTTQASMLREPQGDIITSPGKRIAIDRDANFHAWSRGAPLITSGAAEAHDFTTGESVVVEAFHGTARPDRVGNKFLAKRATSGPMAFFTSDPAVASNYAAGKTDTSLSNEDQAFENWFKVKLPGDRSTTPIDRAWYRLDAETQATINERMPDIRLDDDNNVIYEKGGGDLGNFDWEMKQSARGNYGRPNPLKAAVASWLESGSLFNSEEQFMDVLRLAGFPMKTVEYDSPHSAFPFVYKAFVRMNNPLVTSDIPETVVSALERAATTDRQRAQVGGADAWDKNTRTLRDWVKSFNEERAAGMVHGYVWTSIPDKVTGVFRGLGYDGIVDMGGKGGGNKHVVYIPFGETQIKSALGNKGTFGDSTNDIRLGKSDEGGSVTNPDAALGSVPPVEANRTGAGAAAYLAESGEEPWIKSFAEKMAPSLGNTTITYLRQGQGFDGVPEGAAEQLRQSGVFGTSSTDRQTGKSQIFMKHDGSGPDQIGLLHELVHAASDAALERPENAHIRAEVAAMRQILGQRLSGMLAKGENTDFAKFFGSVIDNDHEMLAYAMSSPTFKAWSQSVLADGSPFEAGKPTLWQRFVDAVRQLVGMSRMYSNRMGELLQNERERRMTFATGQGSFQTRIDKAFDRVLEAAQNQTTGDFHIGGVITSPGTAERIFQGVRGFDTTAVMSAFSDATSSVSKVGVLAPFQTQFHKAEKNPTTFKPVFDAVQHYITDTARFAAAAANLAPTILRQLNTAGDILKDLTPKQMARRTANMTAAASPIFRGTLSYIRDENGKLVDLKKMRDQAVGDDAKAAIDAIKSRGVVFTDAELQSEFGIKPSNDPKRPGPVEIYREFLESANQSLDDLGRTELAKLAGKDAAPIMQRIMGAPDLATAGAIIKDFAAEQARANPEGASKYRTLADQVDEKLAQTQLLKERGYAPLSRFGRHTLSVWAPGDTVRKDPVFFRMFESNADANAMMRDLKEDPELAGHEFTRGHMSQEQATLYEGMNLDALELFANTTGNADNEIYQDFLKLATSNRSILKRLIERKGTAGFSEDVPRVLANFISGNARSASGNFHLNVASQAAAAIPNEQGDIKDDAINLIKYVTQPKEEAVMMRGLLYTNFIGGSVASAAINLTQPFTMTLPHLSQFGGIGKATSHLLAAMRMKATGSYSTELQEAMARATDILSPQEIHHIQGEAISSLGRNLMIRKMAFIWGSMFNLAEQFNRQVSFVAAYNVAKEQQMADPEAFARKSVTITQGLNNKGNKPNVARGAIGATVMTFKQYSISYLEFLSRMATAGEPGSKERAAGRKGVAVALAIMMLTAGAGGLPFAGDIEDLIDTLAQFMGYDFSTKRARKSFIANTLGFGNQGAEAFDRGLSGLAGMPFDVSARMGMSNLIPMTGILLKSNTDRSKDVMELAGAAGAFGKSILDAAGQIIPGALQGDAGQVAGGVLKMVPVAIQNLFKAQQMATTGEYRNGSGQKVMDVDGIDAAFKAIGFQPNSVATQSAAMSDVMRSKALATNVQKEIVSKWAQGLNDNEPDKVAEARAQLRAWNEKNDTPMRFNTQSVINQVRTMRESPTQRLIRSAPASAKADYAQRLAGGS